LITTPVLWNVANNSHAVVARKLTELNDASYSKKTYFLTYFYAPVSTIVSGVL